MAILRHESEAGRGGKRQKVGGGMMSFFDELDGISRCFLCGEDAIFSDLCRVCAEEAQADEETPDQKIANKQIDLPKNDTPSDYAWLQEGTKAEHLEHGKITIACSPGFHYLDRVWVVTFYEKYGVWVNCKDLKEQTA